MGGFAHFHVFRIASHAHDFVGLAVTVEDDMFAEGIVVAEIVAGHGLIDDRHAWPTLVLETEVAAHRATACRVLRSISARPNSP